jgi:hypothetical protein
LLRGGQALHSVALHRVPDAISPPDFKRRHKGAKAQRRKKGIPLRGLIAVSGIRCQTPNFLLVIPAKAGASARPAEPFRPEVPAFGFPSKYHFDGILENGARQQFLTHWFSDVLQIGKWCQAPISRCHGALPFSREAAISLLRRAFVPLCLLSKKSGTSPEGGALDAPVPTCALHSAERHRLPAAVSTP